MAVLGPAPPSDLARAGGAATHNWRRALGSRSWPRFAHTLFSKDILVYCSNGLVKIFFQRLCGTEFTWPSKHLDVRRHGCTARKTCPVLQVTRRKRQSGPAPHTLPRISTSLPMPSVDPCIRSSILSTYNYRLARCTISSCWLFHQPVLVPVDVPPAANSHPAPQPVWLRHDTTLRPTLVLS